MTLKRVKAEPDLLLSATADLDEHEELFEDMDFAVDNTHFP